MLRLPFAVLLATALAVPAAAQRKTCTVTSYGKSCGPVYTGKVIPTGNTNRVEFTLSKVRPGARVFIIVGAEKRDIDLRPIFGGVLECRLFVKLSFLQQHIAMKNGRYTWGHALPANNVGTAYTQAAEVRLTGTPAVVTSNAVELTCK